MNAIFSKKISALKLLSMLTIHQFTETIQIRNSILTQGFLVCIKCLQQLANWLKMSHMLKQCLSLQLKYFCVGLTILQLVISQNKIYNDTVSQSIPSYWNKEILQGKGILFFIIFYCGSVFCCSVPPLICISFKYENTGLFSLLKKFL